MQSVEITPGYDQHIFRLLGDFIGDRAANDALTFEALRIFREKGLKIETFSGNHEQAFWFMLYDYSLKMHHPSATSILPEMNAFFSEEENQPFFRSGQQFFDFLKIAPTDIQERLLHECYHYLNTTHFVTAEFTKESVIQTDPTHLKISSHAPLDFPTLDDLTDAFNLPQDSLPNKIQAIDLALQTQLQCFCTHIQALLTNKSIEIDSPEVMERLTFLLDNTEGSLFGDFLNGREFDFDTAIEQINLADLWEKQHPSLSNIYFVHAHTGTENATLPKILCFPEELIEDPATPHIIIATYNRLFIHLVNLDSTVGQSYFQPSLRRLEHTTGTFYFRTQKLKHVCQPQETAKTKEVFAYETIATSYLSEERSLSDGEEELDSDDETDVDSDTEKTLDSLSRHCVSSFFKPGDNSSFLNIIVSGCGRGFL